MINFLQPDNIEQYCTNHIITLDHFESLLLHHYDLKLDQFVYTHSHDHALLSLLTHLNIKQAVFYTPIEEPVEYLGKIYFDYVKQIDRLEAIGQIVPEGSIVFFQNPSFPDGQWYDLEELFEYWIERNCTIIIDETYLPFTTKQSLLSKIDQYENLYILFSLNQFYGSDQFNTTVIGSNKRNLHDLQFNHQITPYEISYLYHSFQDQNFAKISRAVHSKQRLSLEMVLSQVKHVEEVYSSFTNSICVKLDQEFVASFVKIDESFVSCEKNRVYIPTNKSEIMINICKKIKRWSDDNN